METKKRIRIIHDSFPQNPFKEWDCEPPLMYEGGRNSGEDYSDGAIAGFIADKPTDGFIIRHQKEIAEILDIDLNYFKEYGFSKRNKVDEIYSEIRGCSDIDQLAALCDLFKIPYISYTSRGYSQGSWADVLIVLTDEFFERTGCDRKNSESILQGTKELFDNYMWGDVYGFITEECKVYKKVLAEDFDAGRFEEVEEEEEWEEIDSCWGFYGTKWLENGMLDVAGKEFEEQLKNYNYEDIEYRN